MAAVAGCAASAGLDERARRDTTGDRAEPVGERADAESRCAARAARKARRLGGRRSELGQAATCCATAAIPTLSSVAARVLCDLPERRTRIRLATTGIHTGATAHRDGKTISLLQFESPQLWPLLDEARQVGVRLVQARPQREVPAFATAQLCLDVTADETGDLAVEPVLRVDGATARPVAFIGSSGHGVVYADGGLRLARLDKPAPEALQRMALGDKPLVIPADEAPRFAAEYYPRLRHIAAVTSSDESFTPPEIVGPTLVLRADYQADHELELTWEWAYRLGDNDFRAALGTSGQCRLPRPGRREHARLEYRSAVGEVGLRAADGTLITGVRLSGLETMRFATEVQPLLAELPDVALEVIGDPVDYREAGGSLVIAVTTDAVAGETDWFDLGVTISIEGKQVPFVSVFTALASGQSHLLLPDGAYFALRQAGAGEAAPAHRRGPRAYRCRRRATPDQPIPGRVVRRTGRARSRDAPSRPVAAPSRRAARAAGSATGGGARQPER